METLSLTLIKTICHQTEKIMQLSGVNQQIVDLKVLFVEVDSAVYYNSSQVVDVAGLKTKVSNTLNTFATANVSKFGGRFKYSN